MSDSTVYTLVSKTTTATGAGDAVATSGAKGCIVLATATATGSTILIQGSLDNSVWTTLVTITDAGIAANAAGNMYIGYALPYMRANVSAHGGSSTISVTMVTLDYNPGYWNVITRAADVAGALTVTNLTDSGLTSGRVPYASTGGLLVDEAAFAYNAGTNTLTAGTLAGNVDGTSATLSSLTATRVPFAGTAGLLGDASAFTYVSGKLSTTIIAAGVKETPNVYATDTAITVAPQCALLTKAGIGALTLAAPTATTHDGYIISIISTTANAHVVTIPSGKINGGSNVTLTFGGAIGDAAVIEAYNGIWYTRSLINVTVG